MKLTGMELSEDHRIEILNDYITVYDKNNNVIYDEDKYNAWNKYSYDKNNREIYRESSDGFWTKWELDNDGNPIYCEDCYGVIFDERPDKLEL